MNRISITLVTIILCCIAIGSLTACGSKSNKRAVEAADLDKVMEEEGANAPAGPSRSALTAGELLQVAGCNDLSCVQLFMKERASDFIHAKKGEFASLNRGSVNDSASASLIIPFSTLYVSTDPGATWRVAHTVHKKEMADALLQEFIKDGFVLADSVNYYATQSKAYRYQSEKYPGRVLYYCPTYTPWPRRGLYMNASWMSYVFEVL